MARNRKSNSTSKSIDLQIPEDEQWRLIKETGLLKTPSSGPAPPLEASASDTDDRADGVSPLADEIFNATLLMIPFSFLLFLMEILVHQQYGKSASLARLAERMGSGVPILTVFIFYSNRHKANPRMQLALFLLSLAVGARLIYTVNRLSWLVVIRQCPPLATIWVYTIVQLELLPAVMALISVGVWVWWKGYKLIL